MKSQQVFCSACDREVRVMITDELPNEGQATLHDEELVCLDIGSKCTGSLCPIGATAPDAMVARILRNGLPLAGLRTVRAACPSCGLDTEMVLYREGRATCSTCGSPARWTPGHAAPM